MSRLLIAIFIATIVCVSATDIKFTNEPLPTPFVAYGSIVTSHDITLPNYDGNDYHHYYVVNNLPAQRDETLYEFAALFSVNAVNVDPATYLATINLHVARPTTGFGLSLVSTTTITGVSSGIKKNIYDLGINLLKGDFLVLSIPDDAVRLRVGPNGLGLPVQYGIIEIPTRDSAASKSNTVPYQTTYTLSQMPTNPALPEGQYLQICVAVTSYGVFGGFYVQFGSDAQLFMFVGGANQEIKPADNGKVITDFTLGIGTYGLPGFPDDGTDFPTPVSVTLIIARKNPIDNNYYIVIGDNTRQHDYTSVSHGVPKLTGEELTVQTGDLVGIGILPTFPQARIQFSIAEFVQRTYFTYTGAAGGLLAANRNSVSKPSFEFNVNIKGRSTLNGDPQFAGFQGQSFQFHGLADEHFNLISTPSLQLNAHFVYLSSGKCDYNNTMCFQHPGTYVDTLGFIIPSASGDVHISMVAGSHQAGLRVWIGASAHELREVVLGERLRWSISNTTHEMVTLTYHHSGEVSIDNELLTIDIVNSDYFFNLGMSLKNRQLLRLGSTKHTITDRTTCEQDRQGYAGTATGGNFGAAETVLSKKYPNAPVAIHGLIGQTWRNVRVCQKSWMGAVQDYVTSDLFSADYHFNMFRRS